MNASPINCFISDGQHGYHELDENSPISMLTAKNAKNWFADINNADKVSKWVDDNNQRSSLKENDLILSTRGTVGYCAIVKPEILPANLDQDLARIKLLNPLFKPEYVLSYLNSKFGQDWMTRNQTGMVQQGLSLQKVREIPIPYLSDNFQNRIIYIVNRAYTLLNFSKEKYSSANSCLDNCLDIKLSGNNEFYSLKHLSDSFVKSGRLDAEYYQTKYENILSQLKTNDTVSSLCNLHDSNFIPDENTEYDYIELSNVGIFGDISNVEKIVGVDLPSRARRSVHDGQVIISSVEGSLSSCALIDCEYDNALCSTGFYVMDSEKINSETLLVLFKSAPVQALMKQRCSGTILTAISKDELLNMPLPLIDESVQKEIAYKVQESFRLRKKAKRLLNCALKAVEIAIETDEKSALLWLINI